METREDGTEIKFHLGNPTLMQNPVAETKSFNKRIQKVVVNAEDLMDEEEKEITTEPVISGENLEQEEEREQSRKEEELHPNEAKF